MKKWQPDFDWQSAAVGEPNKSSCRVFLLFLA